MAGLKFGYIACVGRVLVACASLVPLLDLQAVPPETLNYAGRILVDGQAYDGTGQFKFALVNADGNATYWKNAGSGAGEPSATVTLQVTAGVYTVRLGDVAIPNMAPLSGSLFQAHDDVHLRVWFDDGTNGLQLLAPDRAIASVAYALSAQVAESVAPNVITSEMLSVDLRNLVESNASIAPGSITAGMLAPGLLADLNASAPAGDGNGTATIPAGSLIAVSAGQPAPVGYSLYQQGEPKNLVWEEKAPVSVARNAHDGVETLDGKIYFVGGYDGAFKNIAERYDPATNQWETLNAISVPRAGLSAAVHNGKFYAIGGVGHTSVEIFDPQTGQWSAGPALPSEVKYGTAISEGGKILLVGGQNSGGSPINQVLELDPATNQWSQKAAMPTARHGPKLVSFNDKIWAIGGHDGSPLNKVEIYDSTSDSWTTGPSLTNARNWASVWVGNGRIYVAGGNDNNTFFNSIEVYDPATNQWSAAGSLPEIKYHADVSILGDKVFVVAGSRSLTDYSNKVYAADLNASLAGVSDLYFRDGNASAGGAIVAGEVGDGTVTPNKLSSEVVAALKPVILQQPQSVIGAGGGSATFATQATGGNLTYQWRQEGYAIAGANGNFLTITDLNATLHDGNYSVTVSNPFGSTESAAATLVVENTLGLVGWWKFDETSGTVATDSSGNGNHGTLTNGPNWATGKIDGALSLDGVNDYVLIPGSASLNLTGDMSIAAWVYSQSFPDAFVFEKTINGEGNSQFGLFYGEGNALKFRTGDNSHDVQHPMGNWSGWKSFIALKDGSSKQLYVDGVLKATATYSGSISSGSSPSDISTIGAFGGGGGTSWFLQGLVDDVRIYDRALSAAEVVALYNLGSATSGTTTAGGGTIIVADSGPVTTEKLSDGAVTAEKLSETILKYLKPEITAHPQAQTVYEGQSITLSASAEGKYLNYQWKRNGTDLAGETNSTLAIVDVNATQHDGNYTIVVSNEFGSVEGAPAALDFLDTNASLLQGLVGWWTFDETSGTVATDSSGNGNHGNLQGGPTWVQGKINGALSFDGTNDYVDCGNDASINFTGTGLSMSAWAKHAFTPGSHGIGNIIRKHGSSGNMLRFQANTEILFFMCFGINPATHGDVTLSPNVWYHVAATYDGAYMRTYVDGVLDKADSQSGNITSSLNDHLIIGATDAGNERWNGLIDDVRIYDRGLSVAEVQALYQLGGN